jgi:hypothetical protein
LLPADSTAAPACALILQSIDKPGWLLVVSEGRRTVAITTAPDPNALLAAIAISAHISTQHEMRTNAVELRILVSDESCINLNCIHVLSGL